jgi:hypothetical protein
VPVDGLEDPHQGQDEQDEADRPDEQQEAPRVVRGLIHQGRDPRGSRVSYLPEMKPTMCRARVKDPPRAV